VEPGRDHKVAHFHPSDQLVRGYDCTVYDVIGEIRARQCPSHVLDDALYEGLVLDTIRGTKDKPMPSLNQPYNE
jgi:hypothetical protein